MRSMTAKWILSRINQKAIESKRLQIKTAASLALCQSLFNRHIDAKVPCNDHQFENTYLRNTKIQYRKLPIFVFLLVTFRSCLCLPWRTWTTWEMYKISIYTTLGTLRRGRKVDLRHMAHRNSWRAFSDFFVSPLAPVMIVWSPRACDAFMFSSSFMTKTVLYAFSGGTRINQYNLDN